VRCKPPALVVLQSGDQICCSGGPFVLRVGGCIALLGLRQWWWSGSAGPAVAVRLIAGSPAGARGSHIHLRKQICADPAVRRDEGLRCL